MLFITTIHDPYQKLVDEISSYGPKITALFDEVYLCISDQTQPSVIAACREDFANIKVIKKRGAADARRQVLQFALSSTTQRQEMMYCDFDRVITWLKLYPEELGEVVHRFASHFPHEYVVVGRTPEAFETHPAAWKDTEMITNKMSALAFGIDGLDITAGAAIFSRNAGERIAAFSKATHTDCEWPKIIQDNGGSLGEIKVDGLSYLEINRGNTTSELQEYHERLVLAAKITSVLLDH